MCGIAGFISRDNKTALAPAIRDMTFRLSHRGPDSEGHYINRDKGIALGHRRLAILDLSEAGSQPMHSACGRYIISYNGEIYNHREIREKLSFANWKGTSDTETLLYACREWGFAQTLQELNGMFSIALYDRETHKLLLGRDRAGIKPLYYGRHNGHFIFSSELKPVITADFWDTSVNVDVLQEYLKLGYIPSPQSILKNIYKLPPAHFLKFDLNDFEISSLHEYWDFDEVVEQGVAKKAKKNDLQTTIRVLEKLLSDSVKKRMLSDVSLGAFLSGGIDSSLITAFMQKHSNRPVKTYSIGFKDKDYDESEHAKKIAEYLGTEHQTKILSQKDCLDVIQKIPDIYDEPFADSSQIPTHLVSLMASGSVKVVLSGDGADELFAGYNRHFMGRKIWNYSSSIPHFLRAGLGKINAKFNANHEEHILHLVYPKSKAIPHLAAKIEKINRIVRANSYKDLYEALVITSPRYSDLLRSEGRRLSQTCSRQVLFNDPGIFYVS